VTEIDKVNAFGQVYERDFVGMASTVLPSYTPTYPMALPTYSAPIVSPAVTEIDKVNAFGQVYERDFVGRAPAFGSFTAPVAVAAPTMLPSYSPTYPTTLPTYVSPAVTEIDKVNVFGQVYERDFVGMASTMLPSYTPTYPTTLPTYTAPIVSPSVTEIDKENASGQCTVM
jgi:hypothetical protein